MLGTAIFATALELVETVVIHNLEHLSSVRLAQNQVF